MMKNSIENIIKENKIMVIDGSMSTPLENMGVSLNSKLWTAKILAEQPELIKQVHKNYFKAGADCGITCSYQASIPGLIENGYTLEEAENLIRSAVKIFCEARDEWWEEEGREAGRAWPLCLGAAGPYGAYLADGSEYRGNYGIADEQLKEFHKRRVELLHEAGADISGEEYDEVKKVWFGKQSALSFEQYAYSYMKAGASAVGGCCTTVAKHVEDVVRAKKRFCEEQK